MIRYKCNNVTIAWLQLIRNTLVNFKKWSTDCRDHKKLFIIAFNCAFLPNQNFASFWLNYYLHLCFASLTLSRQQRKYDPLPNVNNYWTKDRKIINKKLRNNFDLLLGDSNILEQNGLLQFNHNALILLVKYLCCNLSSILS